MGWRLKLFKYSKAGYIISNGKTCFHDKRKKGKRIPVDDEGKEVCRAMNVPEGYMMPCYIGIGYPADNAPNIEQHTYTAEQKMHFGKW